ncbi:MAG: hypothetical protein ACOVOQ_13310 [Flavobacterium sp.]
MENINNLELWNKVEKTNPKYTKKANIKGNNITAIAPQYQIKNVTEQFGIYGKDWGFKYLEFDYTLVEKFGLVVLHAVFFFPGGEFPIKNAQNLFMDNAMTKIDDNFAKKLETDTLTKAISKLGFNADIFLGLFDDVKYLAEVTKEFASLQKKPATKDNLIQAKIGGFSIDDVKKKYTVTPAQEQEFLTL